MNADETKTFQRGARRQRWILRLLVALTLLQLVAMVMNTYSIIDRQRLHADARLTQHALDSRGDLYRFTLNWQMEQMKLTADERAQIDKLAREAALPEQTTIKSK